ncbi:hypothetical protein M8J77_012512 [Diaphorina citri]|nr:hypothetical protein M8J77_012512 [Diaphorina citri]
MAFRAYAPDVPSRTRARVWHLGPMPQTCHLGPVPELAFRAYAPDVPSRTRARVWHLGPMPQTVSNLPLQPSQSSGALWLKAMCDALWLTAMCDALWLTAMCDALWLTAMCDTLWLTTKGLISLHILSLATNVPLPNSSSYS